MVTLWDTPFTSCPYMADIGEQLAFMDKILCQSKQSIVAIEGGYGMGKTFLAKQYAAQHAPDYPGGITYCENYRAFQTAIEGWGVRGFPSQRHLIVADELAELAYKDSGELNKFLTRFRSLQAHPRDSDVILIGNPVPAQLSGGIPTITLSGLSSRDAERLLLENCEAFGVSRVRLSHNISRIIREARGNPRSMFNMLRLLSDHEGALPQTIETIPALLNLQGEPIDCKSREYGRIQVDLACANDQILRQLQRRPEELYHMSPRQFELFTASILERMGYEIQITPQTRDGGIDIFAARKEQLGSFLCLVQCKRHSPSHPVGIAVVRELYGVLQAERATYASVFTTSYFSKSAIDFQQRFEHQLSLVDYNAIKEILQNIL